MLSTRVQDPPLIEAAPRARVQTWVAPLAGLALLIATIYRVEPSALFGRISQLHVGYVALGAGLVLPQLFCLALRWRQTVALDGVLLTQRRALREYSLSMLLNHLLPFGVAGDAVRVVRAAREPNTPDLASALQGVVLERFVGQLVVIAWAVATVPLWFGATGFVVVFVTLTLLWLVLRRLDPCQDISQKSAPMRAILLFLQALKRALANPRYLAWQLLLSSAILVGLVTQLCCGLWALGLTLPAAEATRVFPLMLLSMSVPLSFAGFGPREAVTAQLYGALSLSAADGAAFAMAFGAMMLCSSLPCLALVLCLPADRTEPRQ